MFRFKPQRRDHPQLQPSTAESSRMLQTPSPSACPRWRQLHRRRQLHIAGRCRSDCTSQSHRLLSPPSRQYGAITPQSSLRRSIVQATSQHRSSAIVSFPVVSRPPYVTIKSVIPLLAAAPHKPSPLP
ncbi:putative membrane protein [Sesbania bispinosa]|nr:putative membrane protein [Sesbania bispinosa]